MQWDGAAPREDRFRIVPVTGRLSLYSSDGVRRIPAALRYAAGLFGALTRRRRRYAAVIVSGLPIFNVFAARLALLGSGTRLVVDYLEVWHRRQWIEYSGLVTGTIAWALQRVAIAITPLATCHSQLSATRLRREGLRRAPLVSPGLIDGAVEVGVPSPAATPPYVLYAGRHIPDKRVDVLPAAIAAAREHIPDLRLVILGTGPSSEAVRAEVRRVGGESWTDFPGFVSEAELDRLMHGALALANPSRREGYGLVVVEANAHGTPSSSSPTRATRPPNSSKTASTASSRPPLDPPTSPGPSGTSPTEVTTCAALRAPGTTPPSAPEPSAAPWKASSRHCRCRAPPR